MEIITRSTGTRVLFLVAVLVGVGAAAFTGARFASALSSSDPSYVPHAEACVNKYLGTIRVVTTPLNNCSPTLEKSLLIASEEKVDELARTYVITNNSGNATTANYADVIASCDGDDLATGGGAWLDIGSPGNTNAGDNVALQASYPLVGTSNPASYDQPDAWRAFARELQNVPGDISPSASSHTPVPGYWGTQPTWSQPNTATSATSSAWTLYVYVICRGNDLSD